MKSRLRINKRRIIHSVSVWCLCVVAGTSIADDIDIYGTSGGTGISPNIMLLLSTSNSMSCGLTETLTSACAYTQHEDQKITKMQTALTSLISGLDGGVSVGLSRYTHPGGAIIYPISMLSSDVGDGSSNYEYSSVYPVIHPNDDAWLRGGVITLDDATFAREAGTADWLDRPYVDIADPDLTVGLRIDNVMIPQGANITEAYLWFHGAKQSDVSSIGNTENLSTGIANVMVRLLKNETDSFTDSSQELFSPSEAEVYETQTSEGLEQYSYGDFHRLDIKSLVQSKVTPLSSDPEWRPGSAMTFLVSGLESNTGTRYVHTNELAISAAPRLVVKYTKCDSGNSSTCGKSFDTAFSNEPVTSVRNKLLELIALLPSNGRAPIAGALLEVANYFRGGPVEFGAGLGHEFDPIDAQVGLFNGPRLGYVQTSQLSHPNGIENFSGATVSECGYTTTRSRSCVAERIIGDYRDELGSDLSYEKPAVSTNVNCATQNHLIFISDGIPDADEYESPVGSDIFLSGLYNTLSSSVDGCEAIDTWACAKKIATEIKSPAGDDEPVRIHVIGFDVDGDGGYSDSDLNELTQLASVRDEDPETYYYYNASDGDTLISSLQEAVDSVVQAASTISIPSVPVNQISSMQHLDQFYYSMYQPSDKADWLGNLKRFRLDGVTAEVVGVNGEEAIINERVPTTDQSGVTTTRPVTNFNPEATSWWTSSEEAPDGGDVKLGGLAEHLDSTNVFSLFGDYSSPAGGWVSYAQQNELTNSLNALSTTNDEARAAILALTDVDSEIEVSYIIDWARSTENMGAPIHSQGQLVTYSWRDVETEGAGNIGIVDPDELYNTAYVSTNRGFLHGFDASLDSTDTSSTRELFRFIPPELLKNLPALANGEPAPAGKPLIYGLDSTWTVFRYDAWKQGVANGCLDGVFCKDDVITAESSPAYPDTDFVFIYAGMRRGGNNYYALDVSSVNGDLLSTDIKPKFRFALLGGETEENVSSGSPYKHMGQTWSQPVLGQINVDGIRTPVIIFAGGYDEQYDLDEDYATPVDQEDEGNAVYIVDAMTGKILWWTSSRTWGAPGNHPVGYRRTSAMTFSIPSKIKVLDMNSDGLTDR
ncbi:MAG: hypothetical protein JKY67_20530, partial [Pseudomonadales bacterium]|nr:hypothetical protein [Pseudomonadales bacterium]